MDLRKVKLLTKRQKIITASVIVSLGLIYTYLVPVYLTHKFIVGLAVVSYVVCLWALWEGINKLKAVILLILPILFIAAVASYYFLLPAGWLTRIPVAFIFGLIFYTLLLSQNVFNVASIRTIPLYRAASTTVFILTLMTAYLLYNVLLSFNLPFYWNGLGVFLISLPLTLHIIWSIEMEGLNVLNIVYSLIISLSVAELGVVLSFWPVSKSMASLSLSTSLFITLGIATHALRDRLSRGVVWEYIGWGVIVFLIALISTSWNG